MRIAFYAPLKPPDDPVPSGDRRIARLFVEALRAAGHEPLVASRLRSYDGDPQRQVQLAASGHAEAARLVAQWRQAPHQAPALWFTYHLYYKAPDWLGPAVAAALAIPYVVAEASYAPKRAGGPWDIGHRQVARALARADAVFGLNPADRACVLPRLRHPNCWIALPPFLDARSYDAPPRPSQAAPRLIAVAMMRPGDKLASYRLLGAALAELHDLPWTLDIVGDGAARPAVERALAPLGARVRWLGALAALDVAAALAGADLFVWPAVNEALGMALLEAQASGLPVVAGAAGGVGGIVGDGDTGLLTPAGDAGAFAAAVRALIGDPARRAALGHAARAKVRCEHDLPVAAGRLAAALAPFERVAA
jgi:glycosyltransferase involved in cell wall biosynthesis